MWRAMATFKVAWLPEDQNCIGAGKPGGFRKISGLLHTTTYGVIVHCVLQVAAGGHMSAALHSMGTGCLVWGKGIGTATPRGSYEEVLPLPPSTSGHLATIFQPFLFQ